MLKAKNLTSVKLLLLLFFAVRSTLIAYVIITLKKGKKNHYLFLPVN